jgi:radical SAM protein with 4Fe4S-binding SPASM domain
MFFDFRTKTTISFMLNIIHYYKNQQWPIRAQLELTERCNFKCLHCYQLDRRHAFENDSILDFSHWEKLLYCLRKKQVLFVRFTGGEPTLHPQFCNIYKVATQIGLKIDVQTNGSILTNQMIDVFTRYLPRLVRISLYGFNKEAYNNFCQNRDAFSNVLKNIDKLREIGVPIHIVVIVTNNNIEDINIIIKYCKSYNIQVSLHFSICARLDGSIPKLSTFNLFDTKNITERWPFIAEEIKRQTQEHNKHQIWENDVKTCWAGLLSFCVDKNHNMFLCPIYRYNKVSLQKVSFEESWQQMRKLRKIVIEKMNLCTKCINRDICGKCSPLSSKNLLLTKENCLKIYQMEEK